MQTRLFFLFNYAGIPAKTGAPVPSLALCIAAALLPYVILLLAVLLLSSPNSLYYTTSKGLLPFYAIALIVFLLCHFLLSQKSIKMPTVIATRLVINNSDVQQLLGCSESTAARKLQLLRDGLGKKTHHQISFREYCEYFGLDYTETLEFLKLLKHV